MQCLRLRRTSLWKSHGPGDVHTAKSGAAWPTTNTDRWIVEGEQITDMDPEKARAVKPLQAVPS